MAPAGRDNDCKGSWCASGRGEWSSRRSRRPVTSGGSSDLEGGENLWLSRAKGPAWPARTLRGRAGRAARCWRGSATPPTSRETSSGLGSTAAAYGEEWQARDCSRSRVRGRGGSRQVFRAPRAIHAALPSRRARGAMLTRLAHQPWRVATPSRPSADLADPAASGITHAFRSGRFSF